MVNQATQVGDPATAIAFTDDGTAKGLVRDPDTAVTDNNSILDPKIQGEEQLYRRCLHASIGKYRNPSRHQRWTGSALDVCPGKCRHPSQQPDRRKWPNRGCGYCTGVFKSSQAAGPGAGSCIDDRPGKYSQ